jgi:regulator of protease activity HflC (stomatin/prohibitin superfamily)
MRKRGVRRFATLVAAIIGLALLVAVSGARFARQEVGYVGVVRNGGPLDDRTIRQILQPGQRLTWIGMFSEDPHDYPASNVNRTYTATADPKRGNRLGVDVVTVPTKDGVQVGVEATVFVRFVGERDPRVLERFDISYGSRRFATPDGAQLYPWQGDRGFYAWMDALFRPVLDYNLREEIGLFQCAQLVASCGLVSRGATNRRVPLANAGVIAKRISTALENDLERTLGQPYLWNIRMRIARITLPTPVQAAVDEAQAKYAAVNAADAELKQAKFLAERNRLLGRAYNQSPALATIETMRALPKGATVFVTTGDKQPSVLVGKK